MQTSTTRRLRRARSKPSFIADAEPVLAFALLVVLGGCATTSPPPEFLVHDHLTLTHRQISPDAYEITIPAPPGVGSNSGAEAGDSDCGLLLSAQMTLAAGYRSFVAAGGDFVWVEHTPLWVRKDGDLESWSGHCTGVQAIDPMECWPKRIRKYTYQIYLLEEPLSRSEELAPAPRRGLPYGFVYDAALVERAFKDRHCPFYPPLGG